VHAYTPSEWSRFFTAQAGASAALAGLVFVGVSINLRAILETPGLVGRALEALILLVAVLLASVFGLVPDQGRHGLGWELLALGVLTWGWVGVLIYRTRPSPGETWADGRRASTAFAARIAIMQAATVPPIVAGATLLAGSGGGLAWMVAGTVGGYFAGLFDAWVLLIEIIR